jgi:hypothetical protein
MRRCLKEMETAPDASPEAMMYDSVPIPMDCVENVEIFEPSADMLGLAAEICASSLQGHHTCVIVEAMDPWGMDWLMGSRDMDTMSFKGSFLGHLMQCLQIRLPQFKLQFYRLHPAEIERLGTLTINARESCMEAAIWVREMVEMVEGHGFLLICQSDDGRCDLWYSRRKQIPLIPTIPLATDSKATSVVKDRNIVQDGLQSVIAKHLGRHLPFDSLYASLWADWEQDEMITLSDSTSSEGWKWKTDSYPSLIEKGSTSPRTGDKGERLFLLGIIPSLQQVPLSWLEGWRQRCRLPPLPPTSSNPPHLPAWHRLFHLWQEARRNHLAVSLQLQAMEAQQATANAHMSHLQEQWQSQLHQARDQLQVTTSELGESSLQLQRAQCKMASLQNELLRVREACTQALAAVSHKYQQYAREEWQVEQRALQAKWQNERSELQGALRQMKGICRDKSAELASMHLVMSGLRRELEQRRCNEALSALTAPILLVPSGSQTARHIATQTAAPHAFASPSWQTKGNDNNNDNDKVTDTSSSSKKVKEGGEVKERFSSIQQMPPAQEGEEMQKMMERWKTELRGAEEKNAALAAECADQKLAHAAAIAAIKAEKQQAIEELQLEMREMEARYALLLEHMGSEMEKVTERRIELSTVGQRLKALEHGT